MNLRKKIAYGLALATLVASFTGFLGCKPRHEDWIQKPYDKPFTGFLEHEDWIQKPYDGPFTGFLEHEDWIQKPYDGAFNKARD